MLKPLNAEEFQNKIIDRQGVSVVVFYTEWSGSYFILLPILEALSRDYKDRVLFYSVDFEVSKELAKDIGVTTIPTLILYRNGLPVDKILGMEPRWQITKRIEQWL